MAGNWNLQTLVRGGAFAVLAAVILVGSVDRAEAEGWRRYLLTCTACTEDSVPPAAVHAARSLGWRAAGPTGAVMLERLLQNYWPKADEKPTDGPDEGLRGDGPR